MTKKPARGPRDLLTTALLCTAPLQRIPCALHTWAGTAYALTGMKMRLVSTVLSAGAPATCAAGGTKSWLAECRAAECLARAAACL